MSGDAEDQDDEYSTQEVRIHLRLRDEQMRQIIDLVPHMIFATDREGRFLLVNKALAEAFDTTVDELMQRAPADVIQDPEKLKQVLADNREVIETGVTKEIPSDYYIDAKGEKRIVRTTKIPFPVAGEEGTAVLGVSVDVTEHRRLEEQLRQSQKLEAMGRLAAGVAHDFGNVVNALHGGCELMRPTLQTEEQIELATELAKVIDHAAALTKQLLAFSKRKVSDPGLLDVNAVVTDLQGMLRHLLPARVKLEQELDPGAGIVRLNRSNFDQILLNLTINARDAMATGGTVTVATASSEFQAPHTTVQGSLAPGRYAVISVRDTGSGMDPELVSLIFEPFFTTKASGEGTGLGLATVYGIVTEAGGGIEVETAPEQGTAFTIYLPQVEDEDG